MSPSFINSSGSPTSLPSLLSRTCHAPRYFMGGEGAWDHINSCLHHASNWTCAHDHVLRALERICNDAGFATTHKRVLTSEGNRGADLEMRNIRVAGQTDLLVDVTVRHNMYTQFQRYRSQWADSRPVPQPRQPGPHPRDRQGRPGPSLLFHIISARASKQPRMERTFLKVHTRPRPAYPLRCRCY